MFSGKDRTYAEPVPEIEPVRGFLLAKIEKMLILANRRMTEYQAYKIKYTEINCAQPIDKSSNRLYFINIKIAHNQIENNQTGRKLGER